MALYTREELEKKCYERCKVAGWNLKRIAILTVDDVQYNKKRMLKYAKDYVEKKLEQDPNNLVFRNEYDFLRSMNFSKFEKEYTIEQIEKKCYECCKKVDWNFDVLCPLDCSGIIYTNIAILKYAKKYMQRNEPEHMDLKEILFFLDDVVFSNEKFNLYYRNAIIQSVNEDSELKNNINFSYILKHKNKYFMDAVKMYCYDYCKEINWQYNKINSLSINDEKYDSLMIWNFAKEYMLKHEPEHMDLKEILFFLEQDDRDFFVNCQDIVSFILKEYEDLKNRLNYSLVNNYFKSDILKYCYNICEKY